MRKTGFVLLGCLICAGVHVQADNAGLSRGMRATVCHSEDVPVICSSTEEGAYAL